MLDLFLVLTLHYILSFQHIQGTHYLENDEEHPIEGVAPGQAKERAVLAASREQNQNLKGNNAPVVKYLLGLAIGALIVDQLLQLWRDRGFFHLHPRMHFNRSSLFPFYLLRLRLPLALALLLGFFFEHMVGLSNDANADVQIEKDETSDDNHSWHGQVGKRSKADARDDGWQHQRCHVQVD